MVHFDVLVDGHAAPCAPSDAPADGAGVIDGARTGCHTAALAADNGCVVATDLASRQQTNQLPVMVSEH